MPVIIKIRILKFPIIFAINIVMIVAIIPKTKANIGRKKTEKFKNKQRTIPKAAPDEEPKTSGETKGFLKTV